MGNAVAAVLQLSRSRRMMYINMEKHMHEGIHSWTILGHSAPDTGGKNTPALGE